MSLHFLKLSFSTSFKYLKAEWQRPVSSEEYRHGVRAIAVCIAKLQVQYSLIDFTKTEAPSIKDLQCTASFLQQAFQKTSLRRSARVLADTSAQWTAYKQVAEETKALPYQTDVFECCKEAKAWLFQDYDIGINEPEALIPILIDGSGPVLSEFSGLTQTEEDKEAHIPNFVTSKVVDGVLLRTDYVEATLSRQKDLLSVRWLRPVSSEEYRCGIQDAAQLFIKHKLQRLLVNKQRLGVLSIGDQSWLAKYYASMAHRSNLQRLAVVSSNDVMQQITDEPLYHKVKGSTKISFHIQYFLSEDEALEWFGLADEVMS